VVGAASCLPLLGEVSLEEGATLIVNPFTAWALLDLARGGGHKALVQTGAAGALGRMILRLADEFALTLVNVVHREEQVTLLHEQGATYVLNSSAPDFEQQLHDLCHELGARLAIDGIAGPLTAQLLAAMPRQSEVVVYGGLSQEMIKVEPGRLIFREQRIEGFWLSPWLRGMNITRLLTTAYRVQKRLGNLLETPVRAQPSLTDGIAAIRAYAGNMTEGKILLTPQHAPGDTR
jgi:NADPH:quinone reductase-like Zn-dependent oxidoreductase